MHENYDLELLLDLVKTKQFRALRAQLDDMNEVDIAEFLDELEPDQQVLVFRLLPKDVAADVFTYLEDSEDQEKIINALSDKELRVRFGAEVDDEALNNPALKKATKTFVGCVGGVLLIVAVSFALQKVDAISDSVKELINNLPLVGMAILFTVGGISAGYIAGIRGKALGGGFLEGVKTIAPCLPMIWAILSITYVLQEGNIIHTILYHVYNLTSSMSKTGALFAIFLFVVALEFIVGSGTAKAFLIMPIVLPLADLLGLTRQSIVLAFTMGDGFCNILYPTSGIMVIAIGMVGISYGKYLRWSWKLFVMEFALSALAMLGAVAIGY